MKNKQAVIFDLDGTLLDTLQDLANSLNRVLTDNALPTYSLEQYKQLLGGGALRLVTQALPPDKREDTIIKNLLEAFLDDYNENWNIYTRPYDGIPELLTELTNLGIKLAILSNKPHKYTLKCVNAHLTRWTFEVIQGQQPDFPRKPAPMTALAIAHRLSVEPDKFYFTGDTAIDMKTATAAEMTPVGVSWGFRPADELWNNV